LTAADKPTNGQAAPSIPPEMLEKIGTLRAQVRESFGKVVMALMGLPRYRHQTLADLQPLVLEPLIRDRIAIAHPANTERSALVDISGFAIWASVSEEVDAKIREQIKAGTWPIRLKAEDWTSGGINWLFDVVAPDRATAGRVIANFRQVVKEGELRLHPQIVGLIDKEMLERIIPPANPAQASSN
jgi:hemolysin-activating ACP:hemolysin acyltransferase